MPIESIPVPRVEGPPVNVPLAARGAIVAPPEPLVSEDPRIEQFLDGTNFPDQISDPIFGGIVSKFNHVFFKTGPAGAPVPRTPGSWHFAAIGDYGSGSGALHDVTTNIDNTKPDLVTTVGDNVYMNGTDAEYQTNWDPKTAFGTLREKYPVRPTLGNHDWRQDTAPYFKRFPELQQARFYSYDMNDAHFIALNSNESLAPGSPQLEWLEKDLASTDKPWKIAEFHHPMFSSYERDNGPLRSYLLPIFEKYGVNLAISGHEHNYERTKPLNDNGLIQVISGGGGHTLYPFITPQADPTDYRDVNYGHLDVEVTPDNLIGRYIVRDGTVRDTFVIPHPERTGAQQAAAGAQNVQPRHGRHAG